ncbi:MAG: ABC transporter permease [Dokdonia sp.]|jgi:lipopolysaccharide transport system permease protein
MKKITKISNTPISLIDYGRRLWRYKHLIFSFALKDFKAKYAQTRMGALWMVIQPIIALVIFSLFFGELIPLETGDVPYPAFAFSGMILWYFFTALVYNSGTSLINAQELLGKVYFPKLILPFSKALLNSVEVLVSFLLLLILLLIYDITLDIRLLLFPLVVFMILCIGLCIGIWLSAISIKNRDLQHLIPYVLNYGIWLTPVFYPTTVIPEQYRELMYYVNPIATTIDFFRFILFGSTFHWNYLLSFLIVGVALLIGIIYFKKAEKNAADYV